MASSSQKSTNPTVERAIAMVKNASLVALDIETTGLSPRDDEIRLVQVSDDESTFIIDVFKRDVRALMRALAREDLKVIAHGASFEYGFVYEKFGIALDNLCDTMLMAQIAACGNLGAGFGLGALCERLLDVELDKEMQLADWSGELSRRHLEYAARDAQVLIPLYHPLREMIVESGQELVDEIERAALPATARMRLAGLGIDKAAWDAHARGVASALKALTNRMLDADWLPRRDPVEQTWAMQGPDCLKMLQKAGLEVEGTTAKDLKAHTENELVGALLRYRKAKGDERAHLKERVLELAPPKPPKPASPWNFGSSTQVGDIAYKILGYYLEDTAAATILRFTDSHPFFKTLLEWRKLYKRESTYAEGWFKDAYDERTGRVYAGWRQIGTTTGRFACSSPNLQNLPNDGPYRNFFVAPEGRALVDLDYSQIEPRIYGKLVGETTLLELYDRPEADVYRSTAALLLGVEESEVTKEQRGKAKAIVLGINYGLSAYGLPGYAFFNFGVQIAPEEAEDLIEGVFEIYPAIRDDHEDVLSELTDRGFVDRITLTGRRRDNITVRNEAINQPVQGTASDGLKMAMARVYHALKNRFGESAYIVGTFHDELLIECDEADAQAVLETAKEAMIGAMDELLNTEEPKVRIEVDAVVSGAWAKG
jgi:DNA polymerase I-like protein with 3'-5' exonuclease and polymerase domains